MLTSCITLKMTNLEFKEFRKRLGLTQEEFAEILGVHGRTIQNWESGTSVIPKVKDAKLRKLASKNHIVLGSQTALFGDAVNGDKITEVRKIEVEEEEVTTLPQKGTCDNDRLFALLEQKQKSLDELIAQQGRYLSIIENLTKIRRGK